MPSPPLDPSPGPKKGRAGCLRRAGLGCGLFVLAGLVLLLLVLWWGLGSPGQTISLERLVGPQTLALVHLRFSRDDPGGAALVEAIASAVAEAEARVADTEPPPEWVEVLRFLRGVGFPTEALVPVEVLIIEEGPRDPGGEPRLASAMTLSALPRIYPWVLRWFAIGRTEYLSHEILRIDAATYLSVEGRTILAAPEEATLRRVLFRIEQGGGASPPVEAAASPVRKRYLETIRAGDGAAIFQGGAPPGIFGDPGTGDEGARPGTVEEVGAPEPGTGARAPKPGGVEACGPLVARFDQVDAERTRIHLEWRCPDAARAEEAERRLESLLAVIRREASGLEGLRVEKRGGRQGDAVIVDYTLYGLPAALHDAFLASLTERPGTSESREAPLQGSEAPATSGTADSVTSDAGTAPP
ncbi:MAG: hypothetical protein D6729_18005 [Deltaproteobacteria bacterium]|nr:MAG: hypothetical protein D6729_18005 [Deltaproteobacteria bacterium]